jgi:hypothetical protein
MKYCLLWLLFSLVAHFTWAQSETATVSGQVVDPSGLNITGAQVKLVDIDRDTSASVTTNNTGLYTFPSVRPGRYRMAVTASGFKVVNVTGVTVNVQDHLEQNFKLVVGSVSESVTVDGQGSSVDTESAAVSTVVDRNFAENLPMNGRSFQTLIQLTPGVVVTPSTAYDSGQFSVNGQRASSNYWMVDGVSGNVGIGVSVIGTAGNGLGGALGSFSAQGGTNSLVSVDALQEFRIQTSTYAPEFGRTPGAQISILTRSGTSQFHGTAFDYLRNDMFDANDWFADATGQPKPRERQNDFGGTFSGPILEDKTFFFFSYEGLRLRLPQVGITSVPDLEARQTALPALAPFLNAFPLPTPGAPDNLVTGVAQLNASYSNAASLDAYSLRIDHKVSDQVTLFGRYNFSPSDNVQRGNGVSLSTVSPSRIGMQTLTAGATWAISPTSVNELRFNYSRTSVSSYFYLDNFGGAVPLSSLPIPPPFTSQDANFDMGILSLGANGFIVQGINGKYLQRQVNVVDNLSMQRGSHSLKCGIDFRRLSPVHTAQQYAQAVDFSDVASAGSGTLDSYDITSTDGATLLFRNLGLFVQDTWRVAPRLTLVYGLRWDIDFVPSSINGPSLPAVTGFNKNDLAALALAPPNTPVYKTPSGGIAPRIGIAYQVSNSPNWQTVFRGGFGIFYDLATSEVGNALIPSDYPFGAQSSGSGGMFPLSAVQAATPVIAPPGPSSVLIAIDPHLKLPSTLQWNVTLEQALGRNETVSTSYIGASGSNLLQTAFIFLPNPSYFISELVTNAGTSNYNALQFQYRHRLVDRLQALASYTWSHSIDTASAGSLGNLSNALLPGLNPNVNRGPSDFDIRDTFSIGLTYDLPVPHAGSFTDAILRDWSTENIVQARSAPPVDVYYSAFGLLSDLALTNVRPDLVTGQSLYLFGTRYPGGKAFNPAAFTTPPIDPSTGLPSGQGNVSRNALRGFGATQWDFAVHRDFSLHESLKLQFRAELFNLLNHPNFGQPIGDLGSPAAINPQFGLSTQMLGRSLNQNPGGGSFSSLYQIGGPRSIQFALKLIF